MVKTEEVDSILNQIVKADNVQELTILLRAIREQLGLANIAYHAIRLPQTETRNPLLLLTYEHEWVQRYKENDYFSIDPVVLFGRKSFLPVNWSEVDRETSCAKRFFSEAKKFDVGLRGLTMPIRGPNGERALFSVTSNTAEAQWEKNLLPNMRNFQLMGHFFHDRAALLSGYRRTPVALSRREKQCLKELAQGKAPKQIACDLSLSASAVQLYLQSARNKLHAKSLTEAAILLCNMDES